MKKLVMLITITLVAAMLSACSNNALIKKPNITQAPIIWDEQRKQLSLEYLEEHYGIVKDAPTIDPKMVVVHWTVLPTLAMTLKAFHPSLLPSYRSSISSASALNVSSQFVIDRDGSIYQLLPETTMARHVIGLNHTAIGIENIADGKNLPMTEKQLAANTALITYLAAKYKIEYVLGHSEYQAFRYHPLWLEKDSNYLTDKNDPDILFMNKLRAKLNLKQLKLLPEGVK
ncbi:MAG: N-acetylmuramoyl-L-alanine amidase [Colwellia sp.]|nr:N-acetylmuramoyl-L-alanine amidase [Colwellia sp.]